MCCRTEKASGSEENDVILMKEKVVQYPVERTGQVAFQSLVSVPMLPKDSPSSQGISV